MKLNQTMEQASKNLKSWALLDRKYKKIKQNKLSQYEKLLYKQKKNFYRIELQKSISSLMLIFINIKNIT